jgi:hypothetical protein
MGSESEGLSAFLAAAGSIFRGEFERCFNGVLHCISPGSGHIGKGKAGWIPRLGAFLYAYLLRMYMDGRSGFLFFTSSLAL